MLMTMIFVVVQKGERMSDRKTIYLDDAIDQLHQSYNLLDAEARIEDLPSAEPEIVRCKDCCHYPSEYADCPMIGWARNENDFCSKAERKDDD